MPVSFLTFSVRGQVCPNDVCPKAGKEHAGNVVLHGRSPQRFRCKDCGMTWVPHRLEFHYRLRTGPEILASFFERYSRGESIRMMARFLSVHPSTIQRWKKRAKAPSLASNSFVYES